MESLSFKESVIVYILTDFESICYLQFRSLFCPWNQSLAQRVKALGAEDKDTIKQWKSLVTEYNISAMKYLERDEHDMVHMTNVDMNLICMKKKL